MDLSEKILKLRKANGLSQDELAEKLGISRQAISKWESGQAMPELENVVKLAEAFDTGTDYLLQASDTDELILKTSVLERQQHDILNQQKRTQNRQFSIISSIIAFIAVVVVLIVSKYVMFPDNGEGYVFLGKTILYGGILIIIAVTVFVNWRFRTTRENTKE